MKFQILGKTYDSETVSPKAKKGLIGFIKHKLKRAETARLEAFKVLDYEKINAIEKIKVNLMRIMRELEKSDNPKA